VTDPVHSPAQAADALRMLAERWAGVDANERASFQTWFLQFCEALGVPAPTTPTDAYRFELPVKVVDRDGELATNFIDAWHAGHFAMEAKMSDPSKHNDALLRKAFGQVRTYVAHVSGTPPPYLMVVDLPRTLMVWDRWSGSYGDFGAGRRIALGTLHERAEDVALLQDVFARPAARDPRGRAQAVTKEIAGRLAALAAALEGRGLDQERVARFLMRCVFSCFAEDVGLLPEQLFRKTLEAARGSGDPSRLKAALELLWKTMDEGGMFGAEMLHRFNGHFFKTREALALEPADVTLLIEATSYDWSRVEPSIFGTLLVRALDPAERHRLGAEYTPREYIERLVEPTVVEPLRERWVAVQASVVQLEESGRKKDREAAGKALRDFHGWLRTLRFLDPACGSGNFLYVTMAAVKRIEHEVLNELQRIAGGQGGLVLEEVHPRQFFGIEIKPWAREIAELTLWIGYHQFWRETHGGRTPPDPILEDTGTIECRDAILAYDDVVHRPEKDRPDPTPRIVHPVTGELVPDPAAKLPYYEYVNARPAEWPEAEFIVGNPPYLGQGRMREAFGDGYVDGLRSAYEEVPDSADLVMFWWHRAALAVSADGAMRAGFITTNSIRQKQNREVIREAFGRGVRVLWVVADHPWADDSDSAAVRVTMSVISCEVGRIRVVTVDDTGQVVRVSELARDLNSDLTSHADVASASRRPLAANAGLASPGFKLHGAGFILGSDEAAEIRELDPPSTEVVRPYMNGRDLMHRSRGHYVIDFGTRGEREARQFAVPFGLVYDRVRPDRLANNDASTRANWWRFGRNREELRPALKDLDRYIISTETSKHRVFSLVEAAVAADNMLICFAIEDAYALGLLSSAIHVHWALAAGGTLEDRPRYNKSVCFDPFPFPDPSKRPPRPHRRPRRAPRRPPQGRHRARRARHDDRHVQRRREAPRRKPRSPPRSARSTRSPPAASSATCTTSSTRLVAEAYGWPWPMAREEILERLVALHDERVEEEQRGSSAGCGPTTRFRASRPRRPRSRSPWRRRPRRRSAAAGGRPRPPRRWRRCPRSRRGPRPPSSRSPPSAPSSPSGRSIRRPSPRASPARSPTSSSDTSTRSPSWARP
jgi:hypothetical protein